MIYRCILPDWAMAEFPEQRKVQEGEFTDEKILDLNNRYYNVYYLPNTTKNYTPGTTVEGSQIDVFNYVFIDMDLKSGTYANKGLFIEHLARFEHYPSRVVDSGNGIHAYWKVSDLDPMSYLRLQRRLCRHFKTDEAVSKIYQLMRVPGTVNTKDPENPKLCDLMREKDVVYTCEQLSDALPPISKADEDYCQAHFDSTYNPDAINLRVDFQVPIKFTQLLRNNKEIKELWANPTDDRSKSDYRLGHVMFAHGFTKDEARSVLVNTAKALERAPRHAISYAEGIISKIWTYELEPERLSYSVKEILERRGDNLKGTRFPCHKYFDDTDHGFRLGQVIGLVAGSGVGKTAVALNMFEGFVQSNPDYHHFFIPLEQPPNEIADRWKTMCGTNTQLHNKVHVMSNYGENGTFRHLSFDEIKEYLVKWKEETGHKIGCVVIDHIGALKKKGAQGENQDLMDICHAMKAFAVQTNTLLVMQSQAPREKAGIGDLELNKDAAYGTVYFESYCDYLVTIWQPLKRCYTAPDCPTITAFKFCKIRHKKKELDIIQEDEPYALVFDSKTEHMRELTQRDETAFKQFLSIATNKRKLDRKTDLVTYTTIRVDGHGTTTTNDTHD